MKSRYCFVCGSDNPKGFHIHFASEGDTAVARYTCEKVHEGWPGLQHGGITSALLDEASGCIPHFMDIPTVTASLNITYHAAIRIGEQLLVKSHAVKISRRLIVVEAAIHNKTGELKASSIAKMMVLTEQQLLELGILG